MKRARLILRLREDEKDTWDTYADLSGLSTSELIRRAVNQHIEKHPPPAATLQTRG